MYARFLWGAKQAFTDYFTALSPSSLAALSDVGHEIADALGADCFRQRPPDGDIDADVAEACILPDGSILSDVAELRQLCEWPAADGNDDVVEMNGAAVCG